MDACRICALPEDEVIASNDQAKAFFVAEPARPGHIATAVREHRPNLTDLGSEEAAALIRLTREVAIAAAPLLSIEKFYLAAVADVDRHVHLHLLPKAPDDPRLGPFLFSSGGWQGAGARRDAALESRIREALTPTPPPRRVELDPTRIESVVAATYACLSFERGEEPDWDTALRLFAPGARLMRLTRRGLQIMDPDSYRREFDRIRTAEGWESFWEGEIGADVEVFGHVARVESHYQARRSRTDAATLGGGVNLFQLARFGDAWKIASILWESWRE